MSDLAMTIEEVFNPSTQAHDWWVYSTSVSDGVLMLECRKTGHRGYVPNPTSEEWSRAFHAPSNPYRWDDDDRVVVDDTTAMPFSNDTRQAALMRSGA